MSSGREGPSGPNPNCDGAGPHEPGEVRRYPIGGGAAVILCLHCWANENKYRYNQGKHMGAPEYWPQVDWATAEVYAP